MSTDKGEYSFGKGIQQFSKTKIKTSLVHMKVKV